MSRLIDARYELGKFELLFRDRIMLISVPNMLDLKYTNFKKKIEIDHRDITIVQDELEKLLHYVGDIVPKLDRP